MSEPVEVAIPAPGDVLLGKYRVVRQLGVGGMGVVVCAEHLGLGKLVALKFLLPEFAALPDAPQRFLREAKAAGRIPSEHVARVIDVDTLPEGPPYMVMEYLEGKDLARYVKEGRRFTIHEAIDFVVQASEALSKAHTIGIIHRDVKPGNLFLTQEPDGAPLVKVLDFGISKVVEDQREELDLTKTTTVMGSAMYMSLEQMRSTKTVDHRTDIYALGVTLYELLTGTHPYKATSIQELAVKVSLDPPDPIRQHRPDVPERLADAIAIAYARHPQDRYPTAGSFAAALEPFASDETRELIKAILRYERSTSQSSVPMVRLLTPHGMPAVKERRPLRVPWPILAAGGGALVAASALLFWSQKAREQAPGTDGGAGEIAPAIPSGSASAPVTFASATVPPAPSGTAVVAPPVADASAPSGSADAGGPAPSGSSRVPRYVPPECRRGELFYRDSTGLRRPCK